MGLQANPYKLSEQELNIIKRCDECIGSGDAAIQATQTKRNYGFVTCKKCGGKGYLLTELGKQVYAIVLNPGGWREDIP